MKAEITFDKETVICDFDSLFTIELIGGIGPQGLPGKEPEITAVRDGDETILYVDGEYLVTIRDGMPVIDDTAGHGDTDKVWSADKTVGVLSGYVKNTDYADAYKYGIVKLLPTGGLAIMNDFLVVNPSNANAIKTGTESYKPVVPSHQHESVFYGLAKAAGDSTQKSSSNQVGRYTEQAKDKIMKMLGIIDMIAPYESTGMATREYSLGDCFIYSGKLCRATTAISIGAAFSSANCEQTTLLEEINR